MTSTKKTGRTPPRATELVTVLLALYGATFAILGVSLISPAAAGYQQLLLAICLLGLPTWALRRYAAPLSIDDLGVGWGPARLTLGVSALTIATVFSVFAVGFHIWQTEVRQLRADYAPQRLLKWDDDLEGRPPALCQKRHDDGKVRVWFEGNAVWAMGPAAESITLEVTSSPSGVTHARTVRCTPKTHQLVTGAIFRARKGRFETSKGVGMWIPLPQQNAVTLAVTVAGEPGDVVTGRYEVATSSDAPLAGELSLLWLLTYFLIHLGAVALPEEWFFRGYLQPRLDDRFGTPLRVLGADVGWGVVLSALAFALLHPILIPGVHRLAVFFPALLFGWLRARTGNIGAAVIVHASANLLQAVLSRFYV